MGVLEGSISFKRNSNSKQRGLIGGMDGLYCELACWSEESLITRSIYKFTIYYTTVLYNESFTTRLAILTSYVAF